MKSITSAIVGATVVALAVLTFAPTAQASYRARANTGGFDTSEDALESGGVLTLGALIAQFEGDGGTNIDPNG